jgi:hypothetical protein
MGLTNFPGGVSSLGVPVVPYGVPFGPTSKAFFVHPGVGSDGARGTDIRHPLQTLDKAHDLCTAGKNDVVFLIGDGSTTATARLTETLVWSKNATHLIGITAPTPIASRARISHASTAPTTAFNMVQVTADGCMFANLSLFEGFNESSDAILWEDAGNRNHYSFIHFGAMGSDGDTGDDASSACLLFTGGGEHYFNRCTFGLDTIPRGAANANVRFRSEVARVMFEDCWFLCSADASSPLFVDANAANALNRWVMFNRCHFLNGLNYSGATALTVAMTVHANANGTILINGCDKLNTTDWSADSDLIKLANMPSTSGDTGGEYVSSDAT